jgi:selT/selW/selH-like putative selenoprotein
VEAGFEAEIIPGSGGQFDVERDGARVFSKKGEGRFPEDGEVLARLRAGS